MKKRTTEYERNNKYKFLTNADLNKKKYSNCFVRYRLLIIERKFENNRSSIYEKKPIYQF